jgi:fibronectin-binding autotransporter adhesin
MRRWIFTAAFALSSVGLAHAQNIAISNVSLPEGSGATSNFAFQISVTPVSATPITLTLDTNSSGTATAGTDYTPVVARSVLIPANTASVTSLVLVNGDNIVESDETFVVQISNATAGTIVTSQALGTINNDDQAILRVVPSSAAEGNAVNPAQLTLSLSNPVQPGISVSVSTLNDSAIAPQDFTSFTNQVVSFPSGLTSINVALSINGENIVEANERVGVVLSNLSLPPQLAPGAVTLDSSEAFHTIANDDSAVLTIANVARPEGNSGTSPSTFALTLSAPVQGAVSVNFATADGSATLSDSDYQSASGTLSFPALSTAPLSASVNVLGDVIVEANQTFLVNLSGLSVPVGIPAGAITLASNAATGTIENDDSTTLSIVPTAERVEGNSGSAPMVFALSLSAPSDSAVSVPFATSNLSAEAGTDYLATNGTVNFAARQTAQSISVSVLGDTALELDESFRLSLQAPTIVTAGNLQSVGTIRDDDGVRFSINDVTRSEADSGVVAFDFTVTMIGTTSIPAIVNFQTQNGSAQAPFDYEARTGSLSFSGTGGSQIITINVLADDMPEEAETFTVRLSSGQVGVGFDRSIGTGTILNDDLATQLPSLNLWAMLALASLLLLVAGFGLRRT